MKTTYLPLGISVLLALSACSGEKVAPPATPAVPAVPAVPASVKTPATPGKATPMKAHKVKPIRRSVKKKTPKPAAPSTETIKKPEEIISTQTIVS